MDATEIIHRHAVPFSLVVFRLAGLFVFTPLLANRSLPKRFRVLLAVMLGTAIYPWLPPGVRVPPDIDLVGLLPLVASELLIGIVIGFVAGLPVLALDMAGYLMGHQMGMGLARVYNPEMGADTDVFGQVLMYVGIAVFVGLGGLDAAFLAVVSTFDRVPIGAFAMDRAPLDAIVGVIASGFELAVRVAAPVLAVVFLMLIAMGFVTKTMPQINVMSVGFTLKMMGGIAMLTASLATMADATAAEVERVMNMMVNWGQHLV